jgi:hypothetical protein
VYKKAVCWAEKMECVMADRWAKPRVVSLERLKVETKDQHWAVKRAEK